MAAAPGPSREAAAAASAASAEGGDDLSVLPAKPWWILAGIVVAAIPLMAGCCLCFHICPHGQKREKSSMGIATKRSAKPHSALSLAPPAYAAAQVARENSSASHVLSAGKSFKGLTPPDLLWPVQMMPMSLSVAQPVARFAPQLSYAAPIMAPASEGCNYVLAPQYLPQPFRENTSTSQGTSELASLLGRR